MITEHPCPPWCTLPAGHGFHILASGALIRDHTGPLIGTRVEIQLVATDHAVTEAGPVFTGPTLVALDSETRRPQPFTPAALRAIARDFTTAADLLVTTAREDTPR